jgi:site-specific DNA-methyltransferase (adenine-specific)
MTPYYEHGGITIYHGDCREILPDLPSVRLIVTDPPYVFGIASTSQEGKAGGWGDLMNSSVWYESWLREAKRLTSTAQGAAWVFNSWRSFPVLARAAYGVSWPVESLLVWDKEWIGPGGQRGLRPSYELAALFVQPDFAIANRGLPDIWRSKWSSIKPNGHPAEKPEPLLAKLIRESGGGLVLDPFMGSGTTLAAAKGEGHQAIGIEIEERYCEIAAKRLSQEVFAFDEATA